MHKSNHLNNIYYEIIFYNRQLSFNDKGNVYQAGKF